MTLYTRLNRRKLEPGGLMNLLSYLKDNPEILKDTSNVSGNMPNEEINHKGQTIGNIANTGAIVGAPIAEAIAGKDPISGRERIGSYVAKGALKGAALGTSIAPGVGTIVGAGLGLIGGILGGAKARREARKRIRIDNRDKLLSDMQRSNALAASNQDAVTGYNVDYYATGGTLKAPLTAAYMTGGYAKPLSSESTELVGDSHEEGGIDIPGINAELEGNETTTGDYVFSKKLGFAKLHKPIARAIGRIEKKPITADRANSLSRLKARERHLITQQEQIKQYLNLPQ